MARPKLEDRVAGLENTINEINETLKMLADLSKSAAEEYLSKEEMNDCCDIISKAALKGYNSKIEDCDSPLPEVEARLKDVITNGNGCLMGVGPGMCGSRIGEKEFKSPGVVGKEPPADVLAAVNALDELLFKTAPELLEKVAQGDMKVAAEIVEWLNDEDTAKDFILLWFAISDELRKKLLYSMLIRQIVLSPQRMGLFINTLSQEDIKDVQEAYKKLVQKEE